MQDDRPTRTGLGDAAWQAPREGWGRRAAVRGASLTMLSRTWAAAPLCGPWGAERLTGLRPPPVAGRPQGQLCPRALAAEGCAWPQLALAVTAVETTHHRRQRGPGEGPPSPGWPPGFLPGTTWLGGQCPRAPLRSRQRGCGVTPRGPPPPPAEALVRAQLAGGASLSWGSNCGGRRKAEALGSALGAWGRSSFPLCGLTAAGQPPD